MKKVVKIGMILFVITLCVACILIINMIVGYVNIDHTGNNQIITSEKYRNVEIAPEACGKITKAAIDDIIEEHGTENIKIIAVKSEEDIKKSKFIVLTMVVLISLCGTFLCWREVEEGKKMHVS